MPIYIQSTGTILSSTLKNNRRHTKKLRWNADYNGKKLKLKVNKDGKRIKKDLALPLLMENIYVPNVKKIHRSLPQSRSYNPFYHSLLSKAFSKSKKSKSKKSKSTTRKNIF